jgi:hypothetical protein
MSKQDFPGQRPNEELDFVFRRHLISLSRGALVFVLLAIIGFLPLIIVPSNTNLIYIGLGGLVIGAFILFRRWISWYFSYYMVTSQRIRYNQQRGLFNRSVVELNFDKIDSVAVNTHGVLGSLLKYGTIVVHTQVGDMVMHKISHAEDVYDKLQAANFGRLNLRQRKITIITIDLSEVDLNDYDNIVSGLVKAYRSEIVQNVRKAVCEAVDEFYEIINIL